MNIFTVYRQAMLNLEKDGMVIPRKEAGAIKFSIVKEPVTSGRDCVVRIASNKERLTHKKVDLPPFCR